MSTPRCSVVAVLAALGAAACTAAKDSNVARGDGMTVAPLSATDQAHVYEAAARGSFQLDDPSLSLLLDPRLLPRTVGLEPAGRIEDSIVVELRRRGAVKGTCEPPLTGTRGTARCTAVLPGYVVRFTPVLAISRDSVQVYLYAQKYDTPSSGNSDILRFERAYQVVRDSSGWRAAREGRVPKEIRGEKK